MSTLDEIVYRPPLEANSALLEVSSGCSYGQCTFCQYADNKTPLQMMPPEVICDNLEELVEQKEVATQMFLLGGNVLAFKSRYLLDLFQLVKSYLPQIDSFSMYARADDVLKKNGEQLKSLKEHGLDTLYIGVESGNADILKSVKKGESPQEIIKALNTLDKAGISYGLSSILGLGGPSLWEKNATDTAALYNQVSPVSIRVMTLTPKPGTPLEESVKKGNFKLLSALEILKEELLLLRSIGNLPKECIFVGNHVSNSLSISGTLPREKETLIAKLEQAIKSPMEEGASKGNLTQW